MSGRLIILPHKTWNVWRRDNVERVRRDERLHAEEEAAKEEQQAQQSRAERLRLLRGQTAAAADGKPERLDRGQGSDVAPAEPQAQPVSGRHLHTERRRQSARREGDDEECDAKESRGNGRRRKRSEDAVERFSLFSEEEARAAKKLAEATKAKQEKDKKDEKDAKMGFQLGSLGKANLWYMNTPRPNEHRAAPEATARAEHPGGSSARRRKRPKFKEDRDDEDWLRRWREEEERMGFGDDYLPDDVPEQVLPRKRDQAKRTEDHGANGSDGRQRSTREKKSKKAKKERKREKKEKKKRKADSEREYIIVD